MLWSHNNLLESHVQLTAFAVFTCIHQRCPDKSPLGRRRVIPVEGGEFQGPKLRGRVLPGGADAMLLDSEGVAHVDVRLALQTDDGAPIYMHYHGRRSRQDQIHRFFA